MTQNILIRANWIEGIQHGKQHGKGWHSLICEWTRYQFKLLKEGLLYFPKELEGKEGQKTTWDRIGIYSNYVFHSTSSNDLPKKSLLLSVSPRGDNWCYAIHFASFNTTSSPLWTSLDVMRAKWTIPDHKKFVLLTNAYVTLFIH